MYPSKFLIVLGILLLNSVSSNAYNFTLDLLEGIPPVAIASDCSQKYEKVSMSFKSGSYTLQGKLVVPKEIKNKLPVIVFCVGSGTGSTMDSYEPFLDSLFLENLPMDKLAVFYFDKRGVGESEGKWYKTTFEERAADAKAAADYLKTLPYIDEDKIAVAGHSQGGWITQICMAKYPETFVAGLSLAGPTFNVKEQVRNDYASKLMCAKNLDEETARKKALKTLNFHLFLITILPVKEEWKQLNVIKKFRPREYLVTVEKPLWLIFGENDRLVSPHFSRVELEEYFPEGVPSNIQGITIGGANHSFKIADFCHSGTTRDLPYSEEAKLQIKNWAESYMLQ